jgi:probable rRNA maturation factor
MWLRRPAADPPASVFRPVPTRSIAIANRHPRLRLDRRALTRALRTLDADFPQSKIGNRKSKIPSCPPGELSLVFLTDAALAQLHADFLDDPTVTDVITFEGNPALGLAGEICVSADAAVRQVSAGSATAPGRTLAAAFSAELLLYVIHGWLHLAGYDDLVPAKKRLMRRAEARALRLVRAAGVKEIFRLAPPR